MWGHQAARKLERVVSGGEVELWDLRTSGCGGEVREEVRGHPGLSHQGCVTNTEDYMQAGGHRGSGGIRISFRTWALGCWCPS